MLSRRSHEGVGTAHGVEEDVVVEGVAAEGEEDQVPPASVGGRLGLEDARDEVADVLDAPGLVVELRHEGVGRIVPDDRGRARGRGPDVGEDKMPRNCSASAIWRAKASAASRSRSQARAASRTRSQPSAAVARAVTRAARMVESGRWVTGGGGGAGKGAVPPAPAAALGPAASPLDRAPRPCAAPHVRISDFLD